MKHLKLIKQDASYTMRRRWKMTKPLLKVEGLKKYFPVRTGLLGKQTGK